MSVDPALASAQPASVLARTDADAPCPPSLRRRGDDRVAVQ